MSASQIIAFSLLVVLVGSAGAAMAKLVRQYVGVTPGGEPELVCEYSLDGRVFERRYPIGNFCLLYLKRLSVSVHAVTFDFSSEHVAPGRIAVVLGVLIGSHGERLLLMSRSMYAPCQHGT